MLSASLTRSDGVGIGGDLSASTSRVPAQLDTATRFERVEEKKGQFWASTVRGNKLNACLVVSL